LKPETEIKKEDWYTVKPYYVEERGNLKFLGIEAPLKCVNVEGTLIVHIKDELPVTDLAELNLKFRQVFGPDTLVFAWKNDILFYNIRKLQPKEVKELEQCGYPVLIEDSTEEQALVLERK
jgi:hypothetical protein